MIEPVSIRPVTSLEDYRRVEALQRQIWGFGSDTEVVPLHLLKAASHNGGLLLGAFSAQGDMVGFVMGFLGRQDGQIKHYSHMLGVLSAVSGAGIGFQLKLAQREAVLAQGIDRITWTVDPLESRNARLNLGKLGVTCSTYHRNWYGELRDELNEGIPTDRFQVDWRLRSSRVEQRIAGGPPQLSVDGLLASGAERVNETVRRGSVRVPSEGRSACMAEMLLVEIPSAFQAVKQADMSAARQWRLHDRELFEGYFGAGYTATEFITDLREGERRSFYLLERV